MSSLFANAVLVHADPRLVRLEETFSRLPEITIPVTYTGFITPMPALDARRRVRSAFSRRRPDRCAAR